MSPEGELHFIVKGKDQGAAASEIPTDQDIYVVADIYGQVKQISIDHSVTSGKTCCKWARGKGGKKGERSKEDYSAAIG